MRIRFNSLKTRLTIGLLLIVVLPTLTVGWMAHNLMSGYIRSDRIADVGRVADAEHQQLAMVLARANSRAKYFLLDLSKQCGGNIAKLNHICATSLIDAYLAAEGAIGATLHRKGRDNLIVGTSAIQNEEPVTFQTGQLAKFSSTGPKSKHSYFVSVVDESTGLRLSITYPSSTLESVFNPHPADIGLSGETFLADGEGYFVTQPKYTSTQGNTLPISAHPMQACLSGQSREVLDLDYRDAEIIHGFRFIPEFGSACIMAHVTQDEAFAPLNLLKQRLIFATLLFCLAIIIVVIYLAKNIVKPITKLTEVTRAIAAGDYKTQAEVAGSDEISGLATSFNFMTNQLRAAQQHEVEALKELRVMFDTSGEGFWKVDQSGCIVEVNDAYCRIAGYARDEIVGAHISKFEAIEQTPEVVAAHMQRIVEQGYDHFETKHRHRDGHLVDIEVTSSFVAETNCFIGFLRDVTERKRAQLEFQHNQDLLNEAQQLAHIGSWERDLMTNFLTCSGEIFRIFEIDPAHEDITYEAFILTVHPEDREMVDQAYMTCIQTRESFNIVHRLLLADGRVKWVNEHGNFYYDASGVPLRSIGTIQDITERKQAEETSRISAQKHQLLFESSRDALITLAPPSWKFTGANQATLQLFGASSVAEFTALGPWDVSPERQPDGRSSSKKAQEMIAMAMREGSCFFEWEHQRLDGLTFPSDVLLTRMNVGEDTFLQASVRDITRRKRTDDILRVAATAFETHEGIVITDVQANIIRVNRAFQDITGYSQEDVLGKNPRARSSGRHDKTFYAAMWQQLLNDGLWTGEIWNKRKNGQIYPEWLTITAVKNGEGETTEYVAIFSDITERKEAEEKLRKHNDELEAINHQLQDTQNLLLQSDKLASIGQLAAGVAHEINNPIGYVSSNLGMLDEYLKELLDLVAVYEEMENVVADSAVLALVKAVKDKVNLEFLKEDIPALMRETQEGIIRVRKIVQDLKDFSRADSGDEWHRADLHKGLDSTLNVASNEIKYKADVKKEYGDIPEVECVSSQLNQVFMNLLVNAAHAIENYGTITVRTGQQGGEVWVDVADTGKGIAPEHINKIFDPFFTTKPIGKGTGLGLSLSYGIIQKHHGRIEVSSEVGKGTSFKVWLPVNQPKDDDTPQS